ncbi:hypothetical protein [Streptomyces sp. Ac-502]|uniref:hypothetical protein n=1 Tax=Streptomyces sp. Ac-502 TaxID=3342801 RepID=UPI00386252AA
MKRRRLGGGRGTERIGASESVTNGRSNWYWTSRSSRTMGETTDAARSTADGSRAVAGP